MRPIQGKNKLTSVEYAQRYFEENGVHLIRANWGVSDYPTQAAANFHKGIGEYPQRRENAGFRLCKSR